jgi:hypothetical protein
MSNYFKVVRRSTPSNITLATGTSQITGAANFQLSNMTNYSELTTLFDQYRIKKIICYFRLVADPAGATIPNSTTANQQASCLDIIATVDHDDDNALTTWAAHAEYSKSKTGVLKHDRWFKYAFYPTAANQIYNGVTSGYAPMKPGTWIDLAYASVPHYGLKYLIRTPGAFVLGVGQNIYIEVNYTYVVEFRNVR